MSEERCVVLRLAGPLQSWGAQSRFTNRDTSEQPTKAGVIGILAAALGRSRQDSIDDLVALRLGVRMDQPGSVLRDFHTVSDYRGRKLPSDSFNAKGEQGRSTYSTKITNRWYLQDAVFVAALSGPEADLVSISRALLRPAFPLALGRRSCVPTQPLLLSPELAEPGCGVADLWQGGILQVLSLVPWQASAIHVEQFIQSHPSSRLAELSVTVDDAAGDDVLADVPLSFDPPRRGYAERRVRQHWARVPIPGAHPEANAIHDPFALLER